MAGHRSEYCPNCGARLVRRNKDHQFTECGLSNVILVNWEGFDCDGCHRFRPIQPTKDELEKILVKAVLTKPTLLSGEEIIFLRHAIGKKIQDFADRLGIVRARFDKLEKCDETIRQSEDEIIRVAVVGRLFYSGTIDFSEIAEIQKIIYSLERVFVDGFHINITKKEGSRELELSVYYSNWLLERS